MGPPLFLIEFQEYPNHYVSINKNTGSALPWIRCFLHLQPSAHYTSGQTTIKAMANAGTIGENSTFSALRYREIFDKALV